MLPKYTLRKKVAKEYANKNELRNRLISEFSKRSI